MSIEFASMLAGGVTFALLPRKVANIGLATALPLAGCVALANHYFNS